MAGRPLKYESPEVLQQLIDSYFANTPLNQQTITGLALALDTSRETLSNYENKDEFFDTIKKAKDRIEHAYEMRGLQVGNAFDIFRLKNMGWKDKTEVDQNVSGGLTWKEEKTYEADKETDHSS
jgi:hypothetical protein